MLWHYNTSPFFFSDLIISNVMKRQNTLEHTQVSITHVIVILQQYSNPIFSLEKLEFYFKQHITITWHNIYIYTYHKRYIAAWNTTNKSHASYLFTYLDISLFNSHALIYIYIYIYIYIWIQLWSWNGGGIAMAFIVYFRNSLVIRHGHFVIFEPQPRMK